MPVDHFRFHLIREMLQQPDGQHEVEFLAEWQKPDIAHHVFDVEIGFEIDLRAAGPGIVAEEGITFRELGKTGAAAVFVVVHQHHLRPGVHRRKLHRFVTFGCAQEQNLRLFHVQALE